jgi:hypothetical protein
MNSQFLKMYEEAKIPEHQHEIFSAVHKILEYFCTQNKISEPVRNKFFKKLQEESFEHPDEILGEATATCLRLWTSSLQLVGRWEFCGILNYLIRKDECMPEVSFLSRGINGMCVKRNMDPKKWPEGDKLFRGACLPLTEIPFFAPEQKYRCPMYLASSVRESVAKNFCALRGAGTTGELVGVIFVIHVDPQLKCWHVNYVERTNCPGEEEFLFVPYSVFTVKKAKKKNDYWWIHLSAAEDNKKHPDDLPLSSWH